MKFFYCSVLFLFLCNAISGHAKIYDCFLFYNEMELLKMRLEELNTVVDYFVLVESVETHKGDLKPLHFKENQHLFAKYLNKIIHIVVERHPELTGLWEKENYHRNSISRGLKQCHPSDIILLSDLDEIPRVGSILSLTYLPKLNAKLEKKWSRLSKKNKTPKLSKKFYAKGVLGFQMSSYFFQLNRQTSDGSTWGGGPWVGTVATTYGIFKKFDAQHFRNKRWSFPRLKNSGWHFTWMGGKDKIRQKMRSVVEGNAQQADAMTDEEIDRWIDSHPVVPVDDTFPNYIRNNIDYLRSLGFIADLKEREHWISGSSKTRVKEPLF